MRCTSKTRTAKDHGFTPAEIIIGVILAGILATGVTIKAVQLMDQARDNAAQRTLRAGMAAARAVYGIILGGGESNFAATRVSEDASGNPVIQSSSTGPFATELALSQYADQEPSVTFVDKHPAHAGTDGPYGKIFEAPPSATDLWLFISSTEMITTGAESHPTSGSTGGKNPNGFTALTSSVPTGTLIRPGEMVIMGNVATSGNSFCVVIVADSSNGSVTGEGYQSVIEDDTKAQLGADCGAEAILAQNTSHTTAGAASKSAAFLEMPKTAGTDRTLTRPVSVPGDAYAS